MSNSSNLRDGNHWSWQRPDINRAAAMTAVNTSRRKRYAAVPLRRKGDPKHGTSAAYQHGCGCDTCVAANTETTRRYREKQRFGATVG